MVLVMVNGSGWVDGAGKGGCFGWMVLLIVDGSGWMDGAGKGVCFGWMVPSRCPESFAGVRWIRGGKRKGARAQAGC